MTVNPQVQVLLDMLEEMGGPRFIDLTPAQARDWFRAFRRPAEVAIGGVEDRTLPGPGGDMPVRLYTPLNAAAAVLPGLVYFHGGGWVIGDLESHDPLCRALANDSGCRVIAIDYRLAPEYPWPAAPDDCFAAVQWIAAHAADVGVDPSRLAVGGDSAGGNLAAVVTRRARAAEEPPIRFQLLIYPAIDASLSLPSVKANAKGYFLEKAGMEWFYNHYIPAGADVMHPDISPLHAGDLSGLPPAYVVTASYDPLADEGRAYADRLKAAGIPVTYREYPSMIHGFFGFLTAVEEARDAVREGAQALSKALT